VPSGSAVAVANASGSEANCCTGTEPSDSDIDIPRKMMAIPITTELMPPTSAFPFEPLITDPTKPSHANPPSAAAEPRTISRFSKFSLLCFRGGISDLAVCSHLSHSYTYDSNYYEVSVPARACDI
jgi:hypothetical protein